MMKGITSAIYLCVLMFFGTAASAQENVCDGFVGAAFGLCNAYCEAMDCDSDEPNANEKACSRVSSNFTKQTGQELPCEGPAACPCFSADDLVDSPYCETDPLGTYSGILLHEDGFACSGTDCIDGDQQRRCFISGSLEKLISLDEDISCQALILNTGDCLELE